MAGERQGKPPSDEFLSGLLRRAREPFTSLVETAGFATVVSSLVRSARRIIELNPEIAGEIAARGVREEGTLWFAGAAAEDVRLSIDPGAQGPTNAALALIPARVFSVVAYRHPYFDGNKRTAFVAAVLVGYFLGFETRLIPFDKVEAELLDLTAREASDAEVADWLLRNVFIPPGPKEVRP